MLAMDGSALGVGTDIGGSLRIPAAYCGIYSLKPATDRISYYGGLGEEIHIWLMGISLTYFRSGSWIRGYQDCCGTDGKVARGFRSTSDAFYSFFPRRSIEDLELFAKVSFGEQGNDLQVAPIPYREVSLPQKLKFGYYTSGAQCGILNEGLTDRGDSADGFIKASPACQRAVQETIDALRKQGHECVEIPMKEGLCLHLEVVHHSS